MKKMGARRASPARSEGEIDILDSLYHEGNDTRASNSGQGHDELDFDGLINNAGDHQGDDDDEGFIALRQAASYRKASNLKGRTVKRSGGFQAMGLL